MFHCYFSAPSAVNNLTVKTISDSGVHLKWNPPQSVNGMLSLYFIEYETLGGVVMKMNTSELQLTIDKLEAYTNYSLKVSR